MEIQKLYQYFLKHPFICTDTRNLKQDSMFFALKGGRFNGNEFADKALEKCAIAIIDEEKYKKDERYVLVNNVLETLQKLAYFHRLQLDIPIIGITGTNGKTTTKELIFRVLKEKYEVFATQGNFNNHIGVPLTILSMDKTIQIGIVEMGANHIGEILELCEIAQPNYGIITNVGKAHLEGFGNFDGVIKAKSELFKFLYNNDGTAFINSDNEHLNDMNAPHKNLSYGTSKFTHVQGKQIKSDWNVELKWYSHFFQEEIEEEENEMWQEENRHIKSKLYGNYNFENILAAICIGNYFGVEDISIKKAIEGYEPTNNRSQVIEKKSNKIILDAYNANPTSMKLALQNFLQIDKKDKIVVLGDMLELGKDSIIEHATILYFLEDLNFKNVILIGPNFIEAAAEFECPKFENVSDYLHYLEQNPLKNHLILIKGSRGIQLEKIVDEM
jgi:UDP-N-acetylmuramoyl-tripeptide--D-alanyl-D-alanine ligase